MRMARSFKANGKTMKLDNPLVNKLGGLLASAAIRHWMATLDYKAAYYDRAIDPIFPQCQGNKIYLFWHEYILFPLYLRGHCNLSMLLSRHRDAEILSHVAHHLGFDFVRGSTNRGGVSALRELLAKSRRMHLTITPDGPRGPRRVMAPGPIYLASKLGLPLVLMGYAYDRPWRLPSWDRFAIPRPCSRARAIATGEIFVPPGPGPRRPGTFPPADRATAQPPHRGGRGLGRIRPCAARPIASRSCHRAAGRPQCGHKRISRKGARTQRRKDNEKQH